MGWHALSAAVRSARDSVVDWLSHGAKPGMARHALPRCVALAGAMACVSALAGVTYKDVEASPVLAAVKPGGSVVVNLVYKVSATQWPGMCMEDAVKSVAFRQVGVTSDLGRHDFDA